MEYKLCPLEIPEDEPFRHDRLNRKELVTTLKSLIESLPGPYVIAVDSPWGTGKTTFLGFLKATMELSGTTCLYFDAWRADFASDPLIAFLGELNEDLSNVAKDNSRFQEFFGKAKKIASVLAKRAIPVAGKIVTSGLLNLDDFAEQAISDYVGAQLSDAVDSYVAEKQLIQLFRENLSAALDSMGSSQADRRLIIIVDELDRCRPTYAIQLLERVKHFFDLRRVIFIIAVDKRQLGVSLGAVYGTGINADEYLRRFFDLEYSLPIADPISFTQCLYDRFGFDEFFDTRSHPEPGDDKQYLVDTFAALCQLLGLSLRACEQCFSIIRIALLSTSENHCLYPVIVSTLAVLKTACPSMYRGYAFGSTSSGEVIAFLESKPGGSELLQSHTGSLIEAYLIVSKATPRENIPELVTHKSLASDSSIGEDERARSTRVLHISGQLLSGRNRPALRNVVGKLELAYHFRN